MTYMSDLFIQSILPRPLANVCAHEKERKKSITFICILLLIHDQSYSDVILQSCPFLHPGGHQIFKSRLGILNILCLLSESTVCFDPCHYT